MKKSAFAAALILGALAASNSNAQQASDQGLGLSGGTTPPTPDCQSTANEPVLLIRNLVEGTTVTGVYAKPYSDYNERAQRFLSVGSLIGSQVNLLGSRILRGKKLDAILGTDDDNPGRCGFPVNFGQFGYNKACSRDKVENLYQMTVYIERGLKKYTVTLTKNVCDETMLDLVPGIPSDNSDKIAPGDGLSGSTPDCETTAGEPKLLLRNLVEGTTITAVRVRPISDYDRTSKSFVTTPKGINISSKPIPGKPLNSVLGNAGGRCGTPINFAKFDFRPDCSKDKMQNLYEMTVNMQRGDQKYTVTLTKNVCDETMVDILPGIPAENK
ncbi:MAG: hypothetical protein ACLQKK_00695 [Rhodomicrobium sp.]